MRKLTFVIGSSNNAEGLVLKNNSMFTLQRTTVCTCVPVVRSGFNKQFLK